MISKMSILRLVILLSLLSFSALSKENNELEEVSGFKTTKAASLTGSISGANALVFEAASMGAFFKNDREHNTLSITLRGISFASLVVTAISSIITQVAGGDFLSNVEAKDASQESISDGIKAGFWTIVGGEIVAVAGSILACPITMYLKPEYGAQGGLSASTVAAVIGVYVMASGSAVTAAYSWR